MTLKQIRELSRIKSGILGAANSALVSNGTISSLINVAQDKLAQIIVEVNEDFFEEQNSKFNLALNSALYSLPTDCIKFKQLRLAYSTPSNPEDYKVARGYDASEVNDVNAEEETIATTNPIVDVTNNYMRIKPTPASAVTNGGLIFYIARPSALAATGDVSVIPVFFHDLMATYTSMEMTASKLMWDRYNKLKAEWEEGLLRMRNQIGGRELDRPLRWKNPLEDTRTKPVTELWED